MKIATVEQESSKIRDIFRKYKNGYDINTDSITNLAKYI